MEQTHHLSFSATWNISYKSLSFGETSSTTTSILSFNRVGFYRSQFTSITNTASKREDTIVIQWEIASNTTITRRIPNQSHTFASSFTLDSIHSSPYKRSFPLHLQCLFLISRSITRLQLFAMLSSLTSRTMNTECTVKSIPVNLTWSTFIMLHITQPSQNHNETIVETTTGLFWEYLPNTLCNLRGRIPMNWSRMGERLLNTIQFWFCYLRSLLFHSC